MKIELSDFLWNLDKKRFKHRKLIYIDGIYINKGFFTMKEAQQLIKDGYKAI